MLCHLFFWPFVFFLASSGEFHSWKHKRSHIGNSLMTQLEQENSIITRLYPFLWNIIIVVVHFDRANLWLCIILITNPILKFVHLLLKCRSRIEVIHLPPINSNFINCIYNQCFVHIEQNCSHSKHFYIHCQVCLFILHGHPTNSNAIFSWCLYHGN